MFTARLPAHLEVAGLIRAVGNAGGFAAVLHRGDRDAGTIALVTLQRGGPAQLWERMPQLDGSRPYVISQTEDAADPGSFARYLARRSEQDRDLWIVELDVGNPERFIS